jgi:hypothetical protein
VQLLSWEEGIAGLDDGPTLSLKGSGMTWNKEIDEGAWDYLLGGVGEGQEKIKRIKVLQGIEAATGVQTTAQQKQRFQAQVC